MLFFLLLKAAPAMCNPSCDDDYSARKIWLEIDSQILNALFCVTGFGLAPWRFRDWYWMMRSVHFHDQYSMRRLFNQNKAWFRPRRGSPRMKAGAVMANSRRRRSQASARRRRVCGNWRLP